ncbi:hypothetical protein FDENT_2855 [Fusarium denticulatum]|uniref:PXA domain-containing protein n=1 Tax=Fusarium denticulatum TaxID=48507 RepID=A0A8H5XF60_9HYPO|nr:hypothetical protein FDENT_2855 [Fusarium denticulatum]
MTATPSMAPAVPPARLPAPRPKLVAFDTESPTSADVVSPTRRPLRSNAIDPLSDRATSLLIRRTLCSPQLGEKSRDSQVPIDELLPPLTSRNDVDLQLYALLAIVMREFVQSWYSKITTDEHFVSEILHIIAHCSRALEQRFRKVDLESLVLDEIPDLLDKHITSYRISHSPIARQPVEVDPREAYHAMCPLPHLAPVPHPDYPDTISDQKENEALYRQLLVQGVLAILLPTEDLENPCLMSLVEQIFSELIIGNVIANKASQPWMLYEGICITARVLRQRKDQGVVVAETQNDGGGPKVDVKGRRSWSVRSMFLAVIQLGMLVVASLRFITTALVMASSLPARATPLDEKEALLDHDKSPPKSFDPVKAPILSCRVWTCLGNLFELSLRMPWLDGFLSLLQYGAVNGPGRIAGHDGPIDRQYSPRMSLKSLDLLKLQHGQTARLVLGAAHAVYDLVQTAIFARPRNPQPTISTRGLSNQGKTFFLVMFLGVAIMIDMGLGIWAFSQSKHIALSLTPDCLTWCTKLGLFIQRNAKITRPAHVSFSKGTTRSLTMQQ